MRRLLFLSLLLLAACARHDDPRVTELVYASPYTPGHTFSRADQAWMRYVEKESGGTLKIRPIWSGGLLSADQSMIELRHGVADIGLITPIYAKGGSHLLRVQTGFYAGAETPQAQVLLYRCMEAAIPQFGLEMQGLVPLAVQGGLMPGIITRDKAVRSLDDLRGMRIRAPTELLAVLQDLGADPVNMPMGEVYSAMAKGVIDGVVASAETFKALHFGEVAKHYAMLDIPRGAYPARAMGIARWNRLSAQHQAILRRAIPVWEAAIAEQTLISLGEGTQVAREEGVGVTQISEDEQIRFRTLYDRDAERNAAKLARFGIDGRAALAVARASIKTGNRVDCKDKI